jgi:osmotically-inducible protein OsmY
MRTWKTDVEIQREVLEELAWDTRVECTDVGVEVNNGVVTLTGTVSSWAKKLAAEEAAHRVAGVLDVANDVAVHLPGSAVKTDTELAAAIRQALIWDVFVPEDRIQTTVSNGLVTLHGEVEHGAQREDAARAIRNIAGVFAVDNRITVKHPKVSKVAIRTAIREALERRADREANQIELAVEDGLVTMTGSVGSAAERRAVVGAAVGTRGVDAVVDKLHVKLPVAAA